MKNNILSLVGLLIGIVFVGALAFLIYTSFASRASQTDIQTQQAESLTSTPTVVSDVATSLTPAPTTEIRIVAQGTMPPPEVTIPPVFDYFRIESYTLEEFVWSEPRTIIISQTPTQTSVVWQLTVKGGPFYVGANDWTIWLDDVMLGRAEIREHMTELSVVFSDRSLLRNGSMISISYGVFGPGSPLTELELLDESR